MADLVVVSMHEKGFPQADYYLDCGDLSADDFEELGAAPDSYFTMRRGDSIEQALAKATAKWPNAKIVIAADETE